LDALLAEEAHEVHVSMIHGDLNLANVLQDDAGNTWLIDYFYTREGPTIHDLAKLESELRFVAFRPGDPKGAAAVECVRAYAARLLGADLASTRQFRIAALRVAANTLSYEDCDPAQKRAALAWAGEMAAAV